MSDWVIHHGDCLELLATLPAVDAIITDPPYGIGADAGIGKYGRERNYRARWDNQTPCLDSILGISVPTCIYGGNYFALPPSRKWLVWNKGEGFKGRDFAECELAWCSIDGNTRVFNYDPLAHRDYHNGGKVHPTQKPVSVMRWVLDQMGIPEGATVLDPYCGSGSTGVACLQSGRKFIGIEKEAAYVEIARMRCAEAANHLFAKEAS